MAATTTARSSEPRTRRSGTAATAAGSPFNVPRPPSDRSIRAAATLLPAMAALLGAAAPAWRPARFAVLGLAGSAALAGALLAVLGQGRDDEEMTPGSGFAAGSAPVTILIPARNEAAVVPALIANLATQRGPRAEVIVIDDGSTDGTAAAAEAAFTTGGITGRVVCRDQGRPGKSRALASAAVEDVPGQIVVVLDADARIDDGFVVACRAALGTGAVAATAGRRMLRPIHGTLGQRLLWRVQDDEQTLDGIVQRARLRMGGAAEFRGNGMVLRASVLNGLGGWPIDALCEDLELSSRLHLVLGHGVFRSRRLVVAEQPVLALGQLFSQRIRWAEGSIRRDLRVILPAAFGRHRHLRTSAEPLAFAAQSLMPWVAIGVAGRSLGATKSTAGRLLAALGGAYMFAAVVVASSGVGREPGSRAGARIGRVIMSMGFAGLWPVLMPVAWVQIVLHPGAPRFVQTAHAPAHEFSVPEPAL